MNGSYWRSGIGATFVHEWRTYRRKLMMTPDRWRDGQPIRIRHELDLKKPPTVQRVEAPTTPEKP